MVHDGRHDGIKGLAGRFGCSLIGHSRALHRETDVSLGVGCVGFRHGPMGGGTQRTGLVAHGTTTHKICQRPACFDNPPNRWDRRPPSDRECHKSEAVSESQTSWWETELVHQRDAQEPGPLLFSGLLFTCWCDGKCRIWILPSKAAMLAARDPRRFSMTTTSSLSSSTTSL